MDRQVNAEVRPGRPTAVASRNPTAINVEPPSVGVRRHSRGGSSVGKPVTETSWEQDRFRMEATAWKMAGMAIMAMGQPMVMAVAAAAMRPPTAMQSERMMAAVRRTRAQQDHRPRCPRRSKVQMAAANLAQGAWDGTDLSYAREWGGRAAGADRQLLVVLRCRLRACCQSDTWQRPRRCRGVFDGVSRPRRPFPTIQRYPGRAPATARLPSRRPCRQHSAFDYYHLAQIPDPTRYATAMANHLRHRSNAPSVNDLATVSGRGVREMANHLRHRSNAPAVNDSATVSGRAVREMDRHEVRPGATASDRVRPEALVNTRDRMANGRGAMVRCATRANDRRVSAASANDPGSCDPDDWTSRDCRSAPIASLLGSNEYTQSIACPFSVHASPSQPCRQKNGWMEETGRGEETYETSRESWNVRKQSPENCPRSFNAKWTLSVKTHSIQKQRARERRLPGGIESPKNERTPASSAAKGTPRMRNTWVSLPSGSFAVAAPITTAPSAAAPPGSALERDVSYLVSCHNNEEQGQVRPS